MNGNITGTSGSEKPVSSLHKILLPPKEVDALSALQVAVASKIKGELIEEDYVGSRVYLDNVDYIDTLIAQEKLPYPAQQQLENMKFVVGHHQDPDSRVKINDELLVKDGSVTLFGFALPTTTITQKYKNMTRENTDQIYTDFIMNSLDGLSKIINNSFDRGTITKENLLSQELGHEEIFEQLNTPDNISILELFAQIVGVKGVIPMGYDNEGHVIYASLVPGKIGFVYGENGRGHKANCDIVVCPTNRSPDTRKEQTRQTRQLLSRIFAKKA